MRLVLLHTDKRPYGPLADSLAPAMLPLMNKPIAQLQIEQAYDHGIKDVVLIANEHINTLRKHFQDGTRLGVSLSILLGSMNGDETESLLKHRFLFSERQLIMSGLCLAHLHLPDLMVLHEKLRPTISLIRDQKSGTPLGFILEPGADTLLEGRHGPIMETVNSLIDEDVHGIGVIEHRIDHQCGHDLKSILKINKHLLRDQKLMISRLYAESPKGVFSGRGTRIHPKAKIHPPVLIGNYTQIMANAEVGPNALLGDNTLVNERAFIQDSIVLDNSYIGEMLRVERKIVAGNRLFSIDTGTKVVITDPFLLGHVGSLRIGGAIDVIFNRGLALSLFLAASPIGLTSALRSKARTGKFISEREVLGAGRIESASDLGYINHFALLHMPDDSLPAAWWPTLLNIIRGEMRIVGPKPMTAEEAENIQDVWALKRFSAEPGLIAVSSLSDDDSVDGSIMERMYVEKRSLGLDLRVALARLASSVASRSFLRKLSGL